MSDAKTHPYTLDICEVSDGRFQWAIRERGKLIQRSDRLQHSKKAAHEHGMKTIEDMLANPNKDDRRR